MKPFSLFVKQFANFFVLVLLFAAALAYAVSFLPGENGRRLTAFFFQEFLPRKNLRRLWEQ